MTKVGCHISIQKGIENSPKLAASLGCEVMQIFTRSPQGGTVQELKKSAIEKFKSECKKRGIKNVYVHAPYFINFASLNNRIYYGSINAVKIELERASLINAKYVMTHLGSAKEMEESKAIKKTVDAIKKVLENYKGSAKLLLENSAGAGKIIGAKFEEIGKILKELKKYSALSGVCLDTQHSFASGYDWKNNFEENIKILAQNIGVKNIKLIHSSDSVSEMNSRKDRHEHLGKGKIGIEGFKKIAKFASQNNIDLICETDFPGVIEDIKILKKFI